MKKIILIFLSVVSFLMEKLYPVPLSKALLQAYTMKTQY